MTVLYGQDFQLYHAPIYLKSKGGGRGRLGETSKEREKGLGGREICVRGDLVLGNIGNKKEQRREGEDREKKKCGKEK